MTAAIQFVLRAAQSFDSQDYYNKSLIMILEAVGELFCENEQTYKEKLNHLVLGRKYLHSAQGG